MLFVALPPSVRMRAFYHLLQILYTHMSVELRALKGCMTQDCLNVTQIRFVSQHVGRHAVANDMRGGMFLYPASLHRVSNYPCHCRTG